MLVLSPPAPCSWVCGWCARGPTLRPRRCGLAAFAGGRRARPSARALPAAVRGHRARDRAFVRRWPGRRRAPGCAPLWSASTFACVLIATAWSQAHAARRDSASNPAAASAPKQFLSYLWQFYLPKLSFMAPKVGPADLRLPAGLHRDLLQRLRLVERQLPPVVLDLLQVGAAHRARWRCGRRSWRAGARCWRAGPRSSCA